MSIRGDAIKRRFLMGAFVDSAGTGLFFAVASIYFVMELDFNPAIIAIGLSVGGALGLFAAPLIGKFADRFGVGHVFKLLMVVRGLGYCAYIFVENSGSYVALTCALRVLDFAAPSLRQAFVASRSIESHRVPLLLAVRGFQNVGLAFGFLAATAILAVHQVWSYYLVLGLNGISFLVAIALIWSIAPVSSSDVSATVPGKGKFRGRLALIGGINGLLLLHDSVLLVVLPIWVVRYTEAPSWMVPALLALNTAVTAGTARAAARLAATPRKARRRIPLLAVLLAISFGCFGISSWPEQPVVAAIVLTAGLLALTIAENLHSAISATVSLDHSSDSTRSTDLAVFGIGSNAQRIVGPLLTTSIVMGAGPIGWAGLAGLLGAAATAYWVSIRVKVAVTDNVQVAIGHE